MGLTGIQIFKLLPKTNCGECGVPTCLAFAMNLASGKAELASCPYVSEEAKSQLAEASAPPIRPLTIGAGDHKVKTDALALKAGLNGIAYPAEGIPELAVELGLRPVFSEQCCSLIYQANT